MGDSKKEAEYKVFPKFLEPQETFSLHFVQMTFCGTVLGRLVGAFAKPLFAWRVHFQMSWMPLWAFCVLTMRMQSVTCCCCLCFGNTAPLSRWSWNKVEIHSPPTRKLCVIGINDPGVKWFCSTKSTFRKLANRWYENLKLVLGGLYRIKESTGTQHCGNDLWGRKAGSLFQVRITTSVSVVSLS